LYEWQDTLEIPDFSEAMLAYRTALVCEWRARQTPDAQDLDSLKSKRREAAGKLVGQYQVSRVFINLMLEALGEEPDFDAAASMLTLLEPESATLRRDLCDRLQQDGGGYQKVRDGKPVVDALGFLAFFPDDDARGAWRKLLNLAVERQELDSLPPLLELAKEECYNKMCEDASVEARLFDACRQAETSGNAALMHPYIDMDEYHRCNGVIEALHARDWSQCRPLLAKIRNHVAVRQHLLAWYWDEIRTGEQDISGMERALTLAREGGLTAGDDREFAQLPAGRLFTRYIESPQNEYAPDLERCDDVAAWSDVKLLQNLLGHKILDALQRDDLSFARHLKQRFKITFPRHGYPAEPFVAAFLLELKEPDDDPDITAERLRQTFEIIDIYDYPADEQRKYRAELCLLFLKHNQIDRAEECFEPEDADLATEIWNRVESLVQEGAVSKAREFAQKFPCKPTSERRDHRRERNREMMAEPPESALSWIAALSLSALMRLKPMPAQYWNFLVQACFREVETSLLPLTEVADLLAPRLDSLGRVELNKQIKALRAVNPAGADLLAGAYSACLPPSLRDRSVSLFRRMLGGH
jgi:hypothetical protein